MARIFLVFVFTFTFTLSGIESVSETCRGTRCLPGRDWSSLCVGAHCPGRTEAASSGTSGTSAAASRLQFHQPAQPRPRQVYPTYQQDTHPSHHPSRRAPLAPSTVIQGGFKQHAAADGVRRTNPRTLTAEVFHPGCSGGTCPTTFSRHPATEDSAARECKGCAAHPRTQQKPKSCVGEGCGARGGAPRGGSSPPAHVTERAAQFLDELPDVGSEGGTWIQLTCDLKPGQGAREWKLQ